MGKPLNFSTENQSPTVHTKSKHAFTECKFLNNQCSCTNLNGPGCLKKQKDRKCLNLTKK